MRRGLLRDGYQMRQCERASKAVLFALALATAGCSGIGAPATSTLESPAAPSPSLGQKITNFFSGASAKSPQTVANSAADLNCPTMDIRPGASTLTIGPTTGDNATMALKYQGTFVRAARECSAANGNMVMRVGVEGRIILGPAGGPGQIDVPLRIAVVDERVSGSKVIVTKLVHIPVTVTAEANTFFTHIEEGLSFPMPPPGDLDSYILYIGFDALAAEPKEKPKPAPKPKVRPHSSTG